MVVHDEMQVQEWTRQPEDKKVRTSSKGHCCSVVAVQSIACCVVVLLALLLRVAGGEAYESLQTRFRQALVRNEWVTALAMLWDGNPLEKSENIEDAAVKQESFTAAETVPLRDLDIVQVPALPLSSGVLTSAYGERSHPIDGTKEFHTGVDIAAPLGADLMAIYSGEVVDVGEGTDIGKYVRLRHDKGIEVLYGHCSDVYVQPGVTVRAGDCVAAVGSTGVSTGSHVHIAIVKDGSACDPAAYVPLERYV